MSPRGLRIMPRAHQPASDYRPLCAASLPTLRYVPDPTPTRAAPAGTGRVTPAARLKGPPHSRTVFTLHAMRLLPSAAAARLLQPERTEAAEAGTATRGVAGAGGGAAGEGASPPEAAGKEDAANARNDGRLPDEDDGGAEQAASGAADQQPSDGDQPSGFGDRQPPAPAPSPSVHVHVRLVTCSLDRSLVFTDLDFPPLQQPAQQQQHAAVRQPAPVASPPEAGATAADASTGASSSPVTGAVASITDNTTANPQPAPSEHPAPQHPSAANQDINSLAHLHTAAHTTASPHGQAAAGRADEARSWRRGPEPPAPTAAPSLLLPRGGSLWWRLTGLGGYAQSLDWAGKLRGWQCAPRPRTVMCPAKAAVANSAGLEYIAADPAPWEHLQLQTQMGHRDE